MHALLDLRVPLCSRVRAFYLLTPYLCAPQRPSLAAPALSLITQCQAFNKSLTGVVQ